MTLQVPELIPSKKYTFEKLRRMIQSLGITYAGVNDPYSMRVTQRGAGPNLSVDVAAGDAWVEGTSGSRQGLYHQYNDATINVGPIAGGDATNPRVDQIILVVNDSSVLGASDQAELKLITGTPAAGAQIKNQASPKWREGAVSDATIKASTPNFLRLADVLVPAKATKIENVNIQDRRQQGSVFRQFLRSPTDVDYTGLIEWTSKGSSIGVAPFSRIYSYITEAGVIGLQSQVWKGGGSLFERTILNSEGGSSFLRAGASGGNTSLRYGKTTVVGVSHWNPGETKIIGFTHNIGITPEVMLVTIASGALTFEALLNVGGVFSLTSTTASVNIEQSPAGPGAGPGNINLQWMAVVQETN